MTNAQQLAAIAVEADRLVDSQEDAWRLLQAALGEAGVIVVGDEKLNARAETWLDEHFPLKADHVMSRVHQMRGGKDNDPNFGSRMKGQGLFADLLRKRYEKASARLGLDKRSDVALDMRALPRNRA